MPFNNLELDPAYGLSLANTLRNKGLEIQQNSTELHHCSGESDFAILMSVFADVLRDVYIATGEVTDEEIETYIQNTHDKSFSAVYYSTSSVIDQKMR